MVKVNDMVLTISRTTLSGSTTLLRSHPRPFLVATSGCAPTGPAQPGFPRLLLPGPPAGRALSLGAAPPQSFPGPQAGRTGPMSSRVPPCPLRPAALGSTELAVWHSPESWLHGTQAKAEEACSEWPPGFKSLKDKAMAVEVFVFISEFPTQLF